ncbi:alcohol dehydrogenase, partial [Colletotrichum plurivorum]
MYSFTVYKGSSDGSIKKATTKKPELTGDQVLVVVTASGLCGTDVHYRAQDMVLGHEGVGIGYEHDSCGLCELCQSGRETFCASRSMYGFADHDQGSFASGAVWKESFLFKIPDSLTDTEAAPLMCAGATVFSALNMLADLPGARSPPGRNSPT